MPMRKCAQDLGITQYVPLAADCRRCRQYPRSCNLEFDRMPVIDIVGQTATVRCISCEEPRPTFINFLKRKPS